jgi:hypothetical protein
MRTLCFASTMLTIIQPSKMADHEPGSQIVPPDIVYSLAISSLPPVPAPMLPSYMENRNGTSRPLTEDEEPETQLHHGQLESDAPPIEKTQFEPVEKDTQLPESCTSRVGKTWFVAIEGDAQAVGEISLPLTQQTSQFREAYTPKPLIDATIQPHLVISRPNLGGLDDLMAGFAFSKADKPEKGKFNRPALPVPAKLQRVAEKLTNGDQPNGKFHFQLL